MKKSFILAVILLVLVTSLCGCYNSSANYQTLNTLSSQTYHEVSITIVSKLDVDLTATIFVKNEGGKTNIQYTYQQLSTFEQDSVPGSFVTTKSGSLVVEKGKIVQKDGEPVDESYVALATYGFTFTSAYFTGVKFVSGQSSNVFSATVTNPSGFTGNPNLVCQDMKVVVSYAQKFQQIQLSYTTANQGSVFVTYNFK